MYNINLKDPEFYDSVHYKSFLFFLYISTGLQILSILLCNGLISELSVSVQHNNLMKKVWTERKITDNKPIENNNNNIQNNSHW